MSKKARIAVAAVIFLTAWTALGWIMGYFGGLRGVERGAESGWAVAGIFLAVPILMGVLAGMGFGLYVWITRAPETGLTTEDYQRMDRIATASHLELIKAQEEYLQREELQHNPSGHPDDWSEAEWKMYKSNQHICDDGTNCKNYGKSVDYR
jgi:hypothetical protein